MANLRIVSDNLAAKAALVASSEAGGLVVANLQLDSKAQVWRSASTTESITAIFSSNAVSCVSLPICNLTNTATMRVRAYTLSGDALPALDTGNLLSCEYTAIDKIDFGDGPLNANAFSYGGGTYATVYFAPTNAEKIIIDIIDSDNGNGYLEASNLVVGNYWSPTVNADYGATILLSDSSKHSRSENGDLKTRRGAIYRKLSLSLSQMNQSDRTQLMQTFIRNGMSTKLFISLFPESTDKQEQQMHQIYGQLTKSPAVSRIKFGFDKSSITIEEI